MFDWTVIARSREDLLDGFALTVMLACLAGALSLVGGLGLCARLKARGAVAWVLTAYVESMRNTPLLITLYLIYFGLPMVGFQIPTFTCVVVVLVMQHSVFVSEVLRGGFLAVPLAQIEAGRALGMRPLAIFRIVQLPQAWSASVPALMSVLVLLIHDTSLGAAISLVDLTMAAKVISQRTAASFEPFVAIAVCYSILSWLLSVQVVFSSAAAALQGNDAMELTLLAKAAPLLLQALGQTLVLALVTSLLALVLGFLIAEAGIVGGRAVAFILRCVIEGIRGIPLLVFVFLIYYLLPKLGIFIDTFYSGCVALALFFATYVAEILRGAFRTIPKVQTEAGKALGMGHWKIQVVVLLPQALRIALPALMNLAAIVIKATSVVSIIGVWELTLATNEVVMRTLAPFTFFLAALAMYFVLCYGTVRCAALLSKRLNRSQRS